MRVAVFGLGHIGWGAAAGLAELGHRVVNKSLPAATSPPEIRDRLRIAPAAAFGRP